MTLQNNIIMQPNIHPYYETITVQCNCGNTFETGMSYKKSSQLKVEICSKCHPFYTGNQKIVDTEGRVENYYSKYSSKKKEEASENS